MDTTFVNSENSKTSDSNRLLLNLSDKMNLNISDKHVALSNRRMYYTWKIYKSHTKTINLKYHRQQGMVNLNYLMDHLLY